MMRSDTTATTTNTTEYINQEWNLLRTAFVDDQGRDDIVKVMSDVKSKEISGLSSFCFQ
jgi:hypothetical protein